jgi:hypothetical protein
MYTARRATSALVIADKPQEGHIRRYLNFLYGKGKRGLSEKEIEILNCQVL